MSQISDTNAEQVAQNANQTFFRSQKSRWFFVGISATLLAALLVAFAPTFFLRGFFDVPPIPNYLYVHGIVLTAWFVLLVAQTCLVAAHRTNIHRRLGVVGAIIAVLVVIHSPVIIVRAVPRLSSLNIDPTVVASVVIWNFLTVIVFLVMVGSGIYLRRYPEMHKRLMLLASFSLVGPVVGRLGLHLLALPPGLAVEFERPVVILLLLFLVTYDLSSIKRVHPATKWGGLLLVISLLLSWILARSTIGHAFIDALR